MKRMAIRTIAWLMLVFPLHAATIIVDPNGMGDFTTIQEAITAAWDLDTIIIQPGVYYECISFNGKAIELTSADPNDPNTVERTIIDANDKCDAITFRNSETHWSILSGITIRNGKKGIFCTGNDTKPVIRNCVIQANEIGIEGPHASPTIVCCTIKENVTGIATTHGTVSHCVITGNGSDGVYNHAGVIDSSVITNNGGWGVHYRFVHGAQLENCIISRNTGGIYYASSSGNVTNCTIVGNETDGIRLIALATGLIASVDATNSIIVQNLGWGVSDYDGWGSESLSYNNIWGNQHGSYHHVSPGENDIHEKPWFIRPGYWDLELVWHEGDYHLRSTVGRLDPIKTVWACVSPGDRWIQDPIDSPCIDRGDPDSSYDREPYPNGGRINMGAYGSTPEASKSNGTTPYCVKYPSMDFNKDCKVDALDLDIFMASWLQCNLDDANACVFVE